MRKPTPAQREILMEMARGVVVFGVCPPHWLGMRRRVQGRTLKTLIDRGWVACDVRIVSHEHVITDLGRSALAAATTTGPAAENDAAAETVGEGEQG